MPTRRTTMIGLGQLLVGGGALQSGAFGASASMSSDVRVVVVSDLTLAPGSSGGTYVETDEDGQVVAFSLAGNSSEGLNQHARTRFEELVTLTNNGDRPVHELYFEFDVEDEGLTGDDPTAAEIAEALQVVSTTDEIDATGDEDYFTIVGIEGLESGESVAFGVQVDLQPGSGPASIERLPEPDRFSVELTIRARME